MSSDGQESVLIVASLFAPDFYGGAEQTLWIWVQELLDAGWNVVVLTLSPCGDMPSRRQGRPQHARLKVLEVGIRNVFFPWDNRTRPWPMKLLWHALDTLPKHVGLVVRMLRTQSPKCVALHNFVGFGSSVDIACRLMRIPYLRVAHDYSAVCVRATLYRNQKPCSGRCLSCTPRVLQTRWFARPKTWLAVSEAVLVELRRRLDIAKSAVVHPPLADYRPEAHQHKYPIAYLGRVSHEKGIEILLDACERAQVVLHVGGAGSPAYVDSLRRAFPRAIFHGPVNARDFLTNACTLVVPSLWKEPFGRVVVEGAVAGCQLILAQQPGLLEAAENMQAPYRTFEHVYELSEILRTSICNRSTGFSLDSAAFASRSSLEPYIEELARNTKLPRRLA